MHGKDIATIRINGGRLCLDFVNTAAWQGLDIAKDFLNAPQDAVIWGQRLGLRPMGHAAADLGALHAMRQAIRVLFLSCDQVERPAPDRQQAALLLQHSLAKHLPVLDLAPMDGGFVLQARTGSAFAHPADAWLLGPVALSAMELLTSPDRAKVKVCGGDGCNWLFLDATRAGTRRWCSMESCGNRVKARTHYETHRAPAVVRPRSLRAAASRAR